MSVSSQPKTRSDFGQVWFGVSSHFLWSWILKSVLSMHITIYINLYCRWLATLCTVCINNRVLWQSTIVIVPTGLSMNLSKVLWQQHCKLLTRKTCKFNHVKMSFYLLLIRIPVLMMASSMVAMWLRYSVMVVSFMQPLRRETKACTSSAFSLRISMTAITAYGLGPCRLHANHINTSPSKVFMCIVDSSFVYLYVGVIPLSQG